MKSIEQLYHLFLEHPSVTIDSRKNVKDSVFFALSGDQFNGNYFAGQAIEKGAALVVVDDAEVLVPGDNRFFLVENALAALQQLARHHRRHFSIPVLAITGTNGKTTTKEAVSRVLESQKKVGATQGNLNNHIGVPLTLLQITDETEIAVIEMGANHPGEIRFLCEIAEPTFGLITNVGKAHLEGFGSLQGVVQTKKELYDYLAKKGGHVFVNADDALLMKLSDKLPRFTYGNSNANITASLDDNQSNVALDWEESDTLYHLRTRLYGSYNFYNLLAAITVGRFFGIMPENIGRALEVWEPDNNRSQSIQTGRNLVILDAYNANPESMRLAITDFSKHAFSSPLLILGDMFELGIAASDEHKAVLSLVQKLAFPDVILVGKEFTSIAGKSAIQTFESTAQVIEFLQNNPVKNKQILVKGSRGMQLETLLPYL